MSWTVFLGVLALLVAVSEWRADWVNVVVPEWTARTFGWTLDALGQESTVRGVYVSCSRCSFEIIWRGW